MNSKNVLKSSVISAVVLTALFACGSVASAETLSTDFESFSLGSIDGQNGWTSTSNDQAVVDASTYGFSTFATKALRVSNEFGSGGFGDQVIAAPLTNSVGETDATAGSYAAGIKSNHFETQFDIASVSTTTEQTGLTLSVSPDRGDGSRMSYLRFDDVAGGIDVVFYDVQGTSNPANFVPTTVATLDRATAHTVKLTLDVVDGPSNDVVKVYIDGVLVHTGTSWENYYRYDSEASAEQSTRIIKTILIRSNAPVPANAGNGFLFDNVSISSADVPPLSTTTIAVDSAWSGHATGTPETQNGNSYVYGVNAFSTIQEAVGAVTAGGTISANGTFSGDVTLSKSLSLVGSGVGTASTAGMIRVNVASTSVSGFSITNPDGNFGIMIDGVGSVSVTGNTIHHIGTGTATGNAYGVYFQDMDSTDAANITVSNNTISDIGRGTTSGNGSNGGIGIGDSTGTSALTAVTLSNNTISNVNANNTATSPGKGAYGIIVNHAASPNTGSTSAQITDNSICDLSGRWAHGIGLEGNTPNTTVTGNTICNATSTNADAWGITVQDNSSASSSSLVINNNAITGTEGGVQNNDLSTNCSLTADPTSVTRGGTATISWSCVNTTGTVTIDNGIGTKPVSGSTVFTFTEARTYVFNLSATSTNASSTPVTTTLTVVSNTPPPSGGGGGGGGGGGSNGPPVGGGGGGGPVAVALPFNGGAPPSGNTGSTGGTTGGSTGGQVLGAATFNFTRDLTIGSTGNDVTELQKFLIAQGFSIPLLTSGSATYGYFGGQTRAAVAAYQAAHGITPAVGYFGPITRASVNATGPSMTDAQRAALIASLTAQLYALQARLAAMIAAGQH